MIRRPPRSTLFPTRRSSDLYPVGVKISDAEMKTIPISRHDFTASGLTQSTMDRSQNHYRPRQSGQKRPSSFSVRSEEHTSELQSPCNLVCRLLLEKKKTYLQ